MGKTPQSRRAVLATCLAGATAGCIGPLSDGPDCTLSLDKELTHEAVQQVDIGYTSNNVSEGGNCNRWTAKRCFETKLWIDPDVIDRIEVKTLTGEVVASWNGDGDTGRTTTSASDTVGTPLTNTTASSTVETDGGAEMSGEPPSVYFELAVLSRGETATREVVIFGDDGELARGTYSLRC